MVIKEAIIGYFLKITELILISKITYTDLLEWFYGNEFLDTTIHKKLASVVLL